MHDYVLVLFVLYDLSEGGVDLGLRRTQGISVGDGRLADEEDDLLPTSRSWEDIWSGPAHLFVGPDGPSDVELLGQLNMAGLHVDLRVVDLTGVERDVPPGAIVEELLNPVHGGVVGVGMKDVGGVVVERLAKLDEAAVAGCLQHEHVMGIDLADGRCQTTVLGLDEVLHREVSGPEQGAHSRGRIRGSPDRSYSGLQPASKVRLLASARRRP